MVLRTSQPHNSDLPSLIHVDQLEREIAYPGVTTVSPRGKPRVTRTTTLVDFVAGRTVSDQGICDELQKLHLVKSCFVSFAFCLYLHFVSFAPIRVVSFALLPLVRFVSFTMVRVVSFALVRAVFFALVPLVCFVSFAMVRVVSFALVCAVFFAPVCVVSFALVPLVRFVVFALIRAVSFAP